MRNLASTLVIMSLLYVPLSGCGTMSKSVKGPTGAWQARNFTLKDLKGRKVSLSDFSDSKAVVIDFWALWCDSCKSALPRLEDLHEKLSSKGLAVLTINTDESSRTAEVRAYVNQRNFTFPVLLDTQSRVIRRFNPSMSLPFTVLLDGNGEIVETFEGYEPGSEKVLEEKIERLLSPAIEKENTRASG